MPNGHVVMMLSNDGVSDPRVEKEAAALHSAGWRVTLLAWDRSHSAETLEDRGYMRIERVGPSARHGGGLGNVGAYRQFWDEAAGRAIELAPDVVHCHDLDTALPGLRVARASRGKTRLVHDFHELYRESKMIPQRGAKGLLARAGVRAIERRTIPAADLIVVANPGTARYYDRFGVKSRLVVVENAPDLDRYVLAGPRSDGDEFRICFIGQKRYARGLYSLMRAVQPHPDMSALLAGGGVLEHEVAEEAARYERIDTSGRVAYADIPALYAGCSAVFAVYEAELGNVRTLFPVKVMEAMAVGVPVLVAKGTWIAEYVRDHQLGYAVDGDDPADVERALVALRDNPEESRAMGLRGRRIVEQELNWKAAAGRLVEAYGRLQAQ